MGHRRSRQQKQQQKATKQHAQAPLVGNVQPFFGVDIQPKQQYVQQKDAEKVDVLVSAVIKRKIYKHIFGQRKAGK